MKLEDLKTEMEITWCPGCLNYSILLAAKKAIVDLVNEKKIKKENVVIVTGIGCHAKIYDYLNTSAFYSLHGRVLPVGFGMKIANPDLTVIGFGGDGDTYAEGTAHFIHSCRYNADMTMIVHNNQVFALTTGQATPTTEEGFKGKSTPLGIKEKPLNPISTALVSDASFVARGSIFEVDHLKDLIKKAIVYPGFALIDVLQPCLAYHDTTDFLRKHCYKLEKNGYSLEKALEKSLEWDYCFDQKAKVPIGIFYQEKRPIFETQRPIEKPFYQLKRKPNWQKIIASFK
jgi:2-oxoglutarate ferredoxin oxidoreductase subunit beta